VNSLIKEIQEADLVITVRYRGGIKAIKNRDGETEKELDVAEVLEMLLPYQPDVLHNPIKKWIKEAQTYLRMKAFW
jgi:hypothetical protein